MLVKCFHTFLFFAQEKAAARAAALAESKTLTGTAASSNGDGVETSSSSSTDAGSAPPAVAEAISFPTLSPEEQWQELLKLLQPQRLMDAPTLQVQTTLCVGTST
jgi:hypothetical protein